MALVPVGNETRPSHWPAAFAALLLILGLAMASLVAMDHAVWRSWAGSLRRPADVTPERIGRFLHGIAFFAGTLLAASAVVFLRRRALAAFARQWRSELALLPSAVYARARALSDGSLGLAGLALAAGAGYRLWYINVPMDYDEAYTFLNFARRSIVEAVSDYNTTNNHLLNTFCMHWCWQIFGQQDWALRLPVLFAGIAVVATAGIWAGERFGCTVGLATMTLTAACPLLVYYSVNARGYMFLTLAALTLDECARRLACNRRFPACAAGVAVVAIALGCWAMPNMVYAIAAAIVGFVAICWRRQRWERASLALASLILGCLGALALWFPAYVFRGTMAFDHPFVRPLAMAAWLAEMPTACIDALASWCQGPLALSTPWIEPCDWPRLKEVWLRAFFVSPWFLVAGLGFWSARRQGHSLVAVAAWPIATFALMTVQRVAPPVRVFLFLAPWFFAMTALGLAKLAAAARMSTVWRKVALAGLLTWHAEYFYRQPVAYDPAKRSVVVDVPAIVEWMANAARGREAGQATAYVPLPCDVPALYYAAKRQWDLTVNGVDMPIADTWLVTIDNESPEQTLNNPAIQDNVPPKFIPKSVAGDGSWRHRARFGRLNVWANQFSRP